MPGKTVHLITLPPVPRPVDDELARTLNRMTLRGVVIPGVDEAQASELVLANTSREEAARLAGDLSRAWPRGVVNVHFRVNARWVSLSEETAVLPWRTDHEVAHLIEVSARVRSVLHAIEAFPEWWSGPAPHLQAQGDEAQIVLPADIPPARAERLAGLLREWVAPARLLPNVPGYWGANGSRHHEFARYQDGKLLPFKTHLLWTD